MEIAPEIQAAFHLPPIYHRSDEFVARFEAVRAALAQVSSARHVALFHGSGTLANDVVASCLDGPGIVLVNGEFGRRLALQAGRWRLPIRVVEWPWGTPWDIDEIEASLSDSRLDTAEWIWAVHLETSTGVLNDVDALGKLARRRGIRLCLDCVSSLGAVPFDMRDVYLASGVSGKALGSYAGVAMVFASEIPLLKRPVPAYLDLAETLRAQGPCFTFSSPLLLALEAALRIRRDYQPLGSLVRTRLRELGASPIADERIAGPVVTTFEPPFRRFLEQCRGFGYEIGGESRYLQERGLVQIATMGAVQPHHVNALFDSLS